jgi:hypothetical protein
MRSRLVAVVAAACAASLALAGTAPAAAAGKRVRYVADGRLGEWRGTPTYLCGHTQISRGELIYTDYLYDDYGPDLDHVPNPPTFRGLGAVTNGDYRYPPDPDVNGYNAADLRELRIAATRGALHALISMQTMKVRDAAVAMLAIDTDGNPQTGAAAWPDGAGIDRTPGADRFVTVWGRGAHVVDAAGHVRPVRSATNLRENAMEVDVPFRLLGRISPTARVWVVTGLVRKGGGGFQPMAPRETAVFNVGFRANDRWTRFTDPWGEQGQGQALAARDISQFAQPLELPALRARRTLLFHPRAGQYYNRVFRSRYDYGEGIDLKQNPRTTSSSPEGTPDPEFRSRWQPYGLYIPKAYDGRRALPLLLDGHSLEVNHNEYWEFMRNRVIQLGEQRNSFVVTPLARGMDTWYLNAGLEDVLEAWNDVRAHYPIDDDRTSISGYSMGGYMTFRLGLLMPDRFARASAWVGPPAYFFWPYPLELQSTDYWRERGNTSLLVDNALNLPYEVNFGTIDELVPVGGEIHQVIGFLGSDDPIRSYQYLADDHLSFAAHDQWAHTRDWLGDHRIDHHPVRVRYIRYPSMDLPQYGLRFDHAYWVSDLEVRAAQAVQDFGEIDATTYGLGGHEHAVSTPVMTVAPPSGGNSPATVVDQHVTDGAAISRRNGFRAMLRNIGSVRLNLSDMGIDPAATITADLAGDGQTTLRLAGVFPAGVSARLDGIAVPIVREAGGVRITVGLTRQTLDSPHRLVVGSL